ncbi:small lysine-rich protein 1 [Chanos chanos]|uniref:Small lysine-rich protein 1 n=1 Tax=Chanos chanos TaxID=29144 RepID=A0A6J2V2F3_CHACN|nr:small lysine-rich protein 1 [Chanos chanos]
MTPSSKSTSRSHSAKPVKKRGRNSSSKKSSSARSTRTEVDILSPAAMENVYYIAHNVVDCLELRGFSWPNGTKKKGKRGKKQKK